MTLTENVDIIIPARYASTRFPGKSLTLIDGIPMIEHVYKRAKASKLARRVIVATDDERIARVVEGFGGQFQMTANTHNTGTDRLFEVAQTLKDTAIIANVQGDEPLINADSIDRAIEPLLNDRNCKMSTIAYPLTDREAILSSSVVKVVLDSQGYALYFSRYPIPYDREGDQSSEIKPRLGHAGLYVYRTETLKRIATLPQTPLEKSESLEQLRALENGIKIKVVVLNHNSPGVDVPTDVKKIEALMASNNVSNVVLNG